MWTVRLAAVAVAAAGLTPHAAKPASAEVVVAIDKTSQRMAVEIDGEARYRCRPELSPEQSADALPPPTLADAAAVPITVIRGGWPGPVSQAGAFPRIIAVR